MNGILLLPTGPNTDRGLWTRPVGGVPYLTRQARLLRAAGADVVVVVGPAEDAAAMQAIRQGFRAVEEAQVVTLAQGEAPDAVLELLDTDAPTLLLRAEWVVAPGAAKRIAAQAVEPAAIAVAMPPMGGPYGLVIAVAGQAALALEWLAREPEFGVVSDMTPPGTDVAPIHFEELVGVVTTEDERAAVEHELWERCRKPQDGIVSRNLNRHISLFISRRIAQSPISPNQISVFTLVLGIVGALLAAQGTYLMVVLGAFLLKANSVLDGVDGELARMRIQSSVRGEWLDTISDDVSNQSFFFAVGWGTWQVTGDVMWLWLGLGALVPLFLTSAIYYAWLLKVGRGDILVFEWFRKEELTDEGRANRTLVAKVTDVLTQLFRRDAFVMMLFLMALAGVVHYTLFVVVTAGWITFIALAVTALRGASAPPETGTAESDST